MARAEPTPAEKETARGLMSYARSLRDEGDLRGALRYFQAADAIMHVPTTSLEVAKTQVALGSYLEARESLRRVLLSEAKPDEPVPFRDARAAAEDLDAQLDRFIGAIKIQVTGTPPGAKVAIQVDDSVVPEVAATLPFKVNPGRHSVVVTAGSARASEWTDVPQGGATTVTLTLAPTTGATGAAAPAHKEVRSNGLPTLAYAGFVAGGAALLLGGVTGELSIASKSSAEEGCVDRRCPPAVWGKLDTAQTLATVSNVSFAIAVLGAGVGVGALLFQRSDRTDTTAATATVRVVPTLGGVAATGRF
jgi:hypothetical protein